MNVILAKGKSELNWKMTGLAISSVAASNMASFWSPCSRRALLEAAFKSPAPPATTATPETRKRSMARFVSAFPSCKSDGVGAGELGKRSVIDGIALEVRFERSAIVLVCVVGREI